MESCSPVYNAVGPAIALADPVYGCVVERSGVLKMAIVLVIRYGIHYRDVSVTERWCDFVNSKMPFSS